MGRRTRYTTEIEDRMVEALRSGNHIDAAADYAGISHQTHYDWLRKASEGDKRYIRYAERTREARATAEIRNVTYVQRAAQNGQWQAAAWWLERAHRSRWGKTQAVELSGPEGAPVQIDARAALLELLNPGDDG